MTEISGSLDFPPVRNAVCVRIDCIVKVMSDRNRVGEQVELYLVEGLSVSVIHPGAIDGPVGKSVIS